MITLHYYDECNFLVECDIGTHLELKEHVSCYAANYKFHPKFKARIWNGKISFYDVRNHLYPIGLFPQVYECAKKFGYEVKLNFDITKFSHKVSDDELEEFEVFSDAETSFRSATAAATWSMVEMVESWTAADFWSTASADEVATAGIVFS